MEEEASQKINKSPIPFNVTKNKVTAAHSDLRATGRLQRGLVPLVEDAYLLHTTEGVSFFIFSFC